MPGSLATQDVLLTKTGPLAGFAPRVPIARAILAMLEHCNPGFERVPGSFPLPDEHGSAVVLYARHRAPPSQAVPTPQHPTTIQFADLGRLRGFDATTCEIPGESPVVAITYYWETLANSDKDYLVYVHLVDPASGKIIAQDDHRPAYPTHSWRGQQYFTEQRYVQLPAGLRASELLLKVGLYDSSGRLPITTAAGEPATSDQVGVLRIPQISP